MQKINLSYKRSSKNTISLKNCFQESKKKPFYLLSLSLEEFNWLSSKIGSDHILRKDIYSDPEDKYDISDALIIKQPVANRTKIGIEMWFTPYKVIRIDKNLVLFNSDEGRWVFIYSTAKGGRSFREKAVYVINNAKYLLNKAGFNIQDLVRTWFYIGDILKQEDSITRYDIMNSIRNRIYDEEKRSDNWYPASTGIGMKGDEIIMECIALKPASDVEVIRIENPLQVSSFQYDLPYERRPRFSRAVLIKSKRLAIMFVSGTASIRGSEVVFPEDVEKQTLITIENIKRLIERDNLKRYGIDWGAELKDFNFLKIYIKRNSSFPLVERICKNYFANIPQLYLIADICRHHLLVEIEGVILKGLT